jgi:hypothetical protein
MDRNVKLATNFTLGEFLPNSLEDGSSVPAKHLANLKTLALTLQGLRNGMFEGKAIRITPNGGGWRSRTLNTQLGGAPQSYHLLGLAADINVAGLTPKQVAAKLKGWKGGLGIYPGHVHVDLGPARKPWVGHY